MKAWAGKRFFKYKPTNSKFDILYTISSAQTVLSSDADLVASDDEHLKAVMVVPKFTNIRLTTIKYEVQQHKIEDQEWAANDMRLHLLLLSHECSGHAKPPKMMSSILDMAWFPGLRQRCNVHYYACAGCSPYHHVQEHIGLSIQRAGRFLSVASDTKYLPKPVQELTGAHGITAFCSDGSKYVVYRPVRNLSLIHI